PDRQSAKISANAPIWFRWSMDSPPCDAALAVSRRRFGPACASVCGEKLSQGCLPRHGACHSPSKTGVNALLPASAKNRRVDIAPVVKAAVERLGRDHV